MDKSLMAHHGIEWEKEIHNIVSVEVVKEDIEDNVAILTKNTSKTLKIENWINERDKELTKEGSEKIRAFMMYSDKSSNRVFKVLVNKAHSKSIFFDKNDEISITNITPGKTIHVFVENFLNDPKKSGILLQVKEALLNELDLSTTNGIYSVEVKNISKEKPRKPLNKY